MTEITFAAGDVLFRAGDAGDRAFRLAEGTVELLRDGSDDAPDRVGTLAPGDVFGEMSLIEERPRPRTARALTPGRASVLTRDEFQGLLLADPASCLPFLRALFERLRTLEAHLAAHTDREEEDSKATGAFRLRLCPLSRKTAQMLPEEGVVIETFPCRLGRAAEAREPEALDLNDLWLLDQPPFQVSRNHMLFDLVDGRYVVRDRGSSLGTVVNEVTVGGRAGRKEVELNEGDNVVVVGTLKSPFRFRVVLERGGRGR